MQAQIPFLNVLALSWFQWLSDDIYFFDKVALIIGRFGSQINFVFLLSQINFVFLLSQFFIAFSSKFLMEEINIHKPLLYTQPPPSPGA